MWIFVCSDSTHNKQAIAQSLPFSKTTGHSSERRAFEFTRELKKWAENYLNSYFNILQRESHVAGFAVEHALTKALPRRP